MQRELYFRKSEDGVSPIIGTVLILGIMVAITGTMLAWGIPQIQQSEAYAIYTSAQNNFLNFDADMDQVILQGTGASRTSTVSFSSGTFVLRDTPPDGNSVDEIRYYYTTVSWSDPKIVGVENGSKTFAVSDSKGVVDNYRVSLTYPNGTSWTGTTSSFIVTGFPDLVYGTKATYTSTENTTQIGGFLIYGVDTLSYTYSSVSGVYKIRMFNGGIVSKEPGSGRAFFVSSNPLIRSSGASPSYDSISLYQTDYEMTDTTFGSTKSAQAGNYNFEARNQGGVDNSFSVYSLRMGFTGDSSTALRIYYQNYWDFDSHSYYFSSASESTPAANLGFEEDIVYSQDTAFDFRILERNIHVTLKLR